MDFLSFLFKNSLNNIIWARFGPESLENNRILILFRSFVPQKDKLQSRTPE